MLNKIIKQFIFISQSPWYWWSFIIGGPVLLSVALYHQHVLEELPCLLCIQVRLLISLLLIIAIIGLLSARYKRVHLLAHISIVLTSGALVERSYMLLGTERGFVFSDCGFNLGLPAWFAIDDWLPWLYRVETTCGYTPELIFGITMAEALMVLSVVLLVIGIFASLITISRINK